MRPRDRRAPSRLAVTTRSPSGLKAAWAIQAVCPRRRRPSRCASESARRRARSASRVGVIAAACAAGKKLLGFLIDLELRDRRGGELARLRHPCLPLGFATLLLGLVALNQRNHARRDGHRECDQRGAPTVDPLAPRRVLAAGEDVLGLDQSRLPCEPTARQASARPPAGRRRGAGAVGPDPVLPFLARSSRRVCSRAHSEVVDRREQGDEARRELLVGAKEDVVATRQLLGYLEPVGSWRRRARSASSSHRVLELAATGLRAERSGLMTKAKLSAPSIPSSISRRHSTAGPMSSRSTQTSFPFSASVRAAAGELLIAARIRNQDVGHERPRPGPLAHLPRRSNSVRQIAERNRHGTGHRCPPASRCRVLDPAVSARYTPHQRSTSHRRDVHRLAPRPSPAQLGERSRAARATRALCCASTASTTTGPPPSRDGRKRGNLLRTADGEVIARVGGDPALTLELLTAYPDGREPAPTTASARRPTCSETRGEWRATRATPGGSTGASCATTAAGTGCSTGSGSTTTPRTCSGSASTTATGR